MYENNSEEWTVTPLTLIMIFIISALSWLGLLYLIQTVWGVLCY